MRPNVKIIFIAVPMYSIVEWNRNKGHPDPDTFTQNQYRLEKAITDLNMAIKEINAPSLPPQLTQDMYFSIKRKASQAQTRKICYELLLDGIHPGKPISELWLIRIKLFTGVLGL